MNRNRKIVVVSALGIVALVVTTGWSVLAGAAWPPEPYQACSITGVWTTQTGPGEIGVITVGAEDPRTGIASAHLEIPGHDYTGGGVFADIDSYTPWMGIRVRTGKNTFQGTSVIYFMENAKPPVVTWFGVLNETCTFTGPDTVEATGTLSIYSAVEHPGHMFGNLPDQDKNGDGLPDEGQKPIICMPTSGVVHRLGLMPPAEPTPMPQPPK